MGGIPGWFWVKTLAIKFKIKEKNDNYHKVELLDMPTVINSKTSCEGPFFDRMSRPKIEARPKVLAVIVLRN